MEVVNARAGLLSNFEVLDWLREQEATHLLRTKAALRVKKDDENPPPPPTPHLEASQNLRTIQVEAITYLSADYLPTANQTDAAVTSLVKGLAPYNLTKAEKLQIANLVPTLPVELYVIVEELEDRLGEQLDEILNLVQASRAADPVDTAVQPTTTTSTVLAEPQQSSWDDDADAVYDEEFFDDTGAGAGVEGDLELDED